MRTTIVVSVGVGVVVVGLLVQLMRRKPSSREDAGTVSGQWLAEQSSKSDQHWT